MAVVSFWASCVFHRMVVFGLCMLCVMTRMAGVEVAVHGIINVMAMVASRMCRVTKRVVCIV